MVDDKKSILAWSFYDWGNSAFATTAMGVFLPILFRELTAGQLTDNDITFWYGIGTGLVSLIVAIMAPFLGAAADRMGGKKKFLFLFALLGIVMTGSVALIQAGMWIAGLVIFALAGMGFEGANVFYDSLLPSVASENKRHYVSSLGFSLGYLGGGILLLVNLIIYAAPQLFGLPFAKESLQGLQLNLLSVAIWWAVFSIPIAFLVKEPPVENKVPFGKAIGAGWQQIKTTFRDVRKLKYVALFLVAYWLYIDGVGTIIKMAVLYGGNVGVNQTIMGLTFLIVQLVAFPMTMLYHLFAKRIGVKRAILIAIIGYSVITIFGFFMTGSTMFIVLGVMVGCFQGGIQALSRSAYSQLIPIDKSAEFYGFFDMIGKFASIIGPVLMGVVPVLVEPILPPALQSEAFRFGILAIIILFIIGGLLLTRVDFEAGARIAKESLAGAQEKREEPSPKA